MEYADKGDLYERIAEHKKLGKRKGFILKCAALGTEDEILNLFVMMVLAVKHIHDRRILHRDLKT